MKRKVLTLSLFVAVLFASSCGPLIHKKTGSSKLDTIKMTLPNKDKFNNLASLLTGYRLVIMPTSIDCNNATKLDHVADWDESEISQKIYRECDYLVKLELGSKKTTDDELSSVFLSSDATKRGALVLRKEMFSDNNEISVNIVLGASTEGEKLGFTEVLQESEGQKYLTIKVNLEITSDPQKPEPEPEPEQDTGECVFSFGPIPEAKPDGSRGSTYSGHGSARDYGKSEGTKLYTMGTCSRRWVTSDEDGNNCGNGIGFTCNINNETMIVTYCHMRDLPISKKEYAMAEFVGYVGSTGNSTGPHLHLGLKNGDQTAVEGNNPDLWIRNQECYNDPR